MGFIGSMFCNGHGFNSNNANYRTCFGFWLFFSFSFRYSEELYMKKVKNKIFSFYHCKECLDEICAKQSIGDEVSPREYANYEFGATEKGFQLWCVRHEKNILALDLLGQKVSYDQ